jgi:hypothetical protein
MHWQHIGNLKATWLPVPATQPSPTGPPPSHAHFGQVQVDAVRPAEQGLYCPPFCTCLHSVRTATTAANSGFCVEVEMEAPLLPPPHTPGPRPHLTHTQLPKKNPATSSMEMTQGRTCASTVQHCDPTMHSQSRGGACVLARAARHLFLPTLQLNRDAYGEPRADVHEGEGAPTHYDRRHALLGTLRREGGGVKGEPNLESQCRSAPPPPAPTASC